MRQLYHTTENWTFKKMKTKTDAHNNPKSSRSPKAVYEISRVGVVRDIPYTVTLPFLRYPVPA